MMSDYPDSMSAHPIAIVIAASRGMGAACARPIAIDGYCVSLMSPNHEPRYVIRESSCMDGGFIWAVR